MFIGWHRETLTFHGGEEDFRLVLRLSIPAFVAPSG